MPLRRGEGGECQRDVTVWKVSICIGIIHLILKRFVKKKGFTGIKSRTGWGGGFRK